MDDEDRSVKSTQWRDIPAIFLLVVLLTTVYTRLVATGWTDELIITRTITYIGLAAGILLGMSRFSPRLTAFFASIYGLFIIPWRVGLSLGEGIAWQERLISLAGRLGVILNHLVQQKAVPDNLLFLVLMCLVFWVLSAHAGYSLIRYGNPWTVILPSGIALVLIHSYDAFIGSRNWYLAIYLLFALLLIARLVFLQNRHRWENSNTYMPPYLGVDFVRITLIISVVLLLFSWTMPALAETLPAAENAWQRLKQPWNDLRNTFDNAFASLRSSVGIVSDYYGPNLLLGRGNRLSDSVIFFALTPADPPEGTRYYYRARVYDFYDNGWKSNMLNTRNVDPTDFDLQFPDLADNYPGEYVFAFTIGNPISTLFTPNQPVWISRPAKAEFELLPDGSADLSTLRATPPLRSGETYTVRVSLNEVTVNQLRNAGMDYPQWVKDRYLQLPPTITQRTRDLAQSLAAGKETPYDIASAITAHLRTNIKYAETIPSLPIDRELVDWFLFDLQEGFCNYYASAEIVLLRSLGIPARLAAGYAQGEPTETPNAYVIRQRDSHAWPEVYFPGIGWVEFEPTASQPPLLRPLGDSQGDNQQDITDSTLTDDRLDNLRALQNLRGLAEDAGPVAGGELGGTNLVLVIAAGLLVALILLMIPLLRNNRVQQRLLSVPIALELGFRRVGLQPPSFLRRWAHRASLSPLSRAYLEISLALSRLGHHPQPYLTPAERGSALVSELPPTDAATHTLLDVYHTAVYSAYNHPDLAAARRASLEIRWASLKEYALRLINRFRPHGDAFR